MRTASRTTGGFTSVVVLAHGDPMLAKVYSAAVLGVDAYEVEVEVNTAGGNPVVVVVGLPDVAVKESRDRVTTAVNNSGYRWPNGRTTINLAPADIVSRKKYCDSQHILRLKTTYNAIKFGVSLPLDGRSGKL